MAIRRADRDGRTNPPSAVARSAAQSRDAVFRLRRKLTKRFSDVEVRQLRTLQRAFNSKTGAPDLLVFGDSAMFATHAKDTDRRHLAELIQAGLPPRTSFEALVGPGYNPRIVMAFLSALPGCRSMPRAVIVPASVLMASTTWLNHPFLGYTEASAHMREVIEGGNRAPRRLARAASDAEGRYERSVAPSLIGLTRTIGELRLITNATPASPWQHVVRVRHLMDHLNAERLETDSVGVELVGEMAEMLSKLGVPSVAYIPPVNQEVVAKVLGPHAPEHVARNAAIIEDAFASSCGPLGSVVNGIADSTADEYSDLIHLNAAGRQRFATRIADAVRPHLV